MELPVWLEWLTALTISYLLGSIPTGYLMGRFLKGIDIRQAGSGNLGATNVFRVLGKWPGTVTLIFDISKGFLSVAVLGSFCSDGSCSESLSRLFCGLGAIAGHNWTCFLRFRGGKGIATSAGVFLGLSPLVTLVLMAVWALIAYLTKYVSAASVVASVFLPISLFLFNKPREWVIAGIVLTLVSVWKHRTNIRRLMDGTEPRMGEKVRETAKL